MSVLVYTTEVLPLRCRLRLLHRRYRLFLRNHLRQPLPPPYHHRRHPLRMARRLERSRRLLLLREGRDVTRLGRPPAIVREDVDLLKRFVDHPDTMFGIVRADVNGVGPPQHFVPLGPVLNMVAIGVHDDDAVR